MSQTHPKLLHLLLCPTNYTPLMFPQVPKPVATVFLRVRQQRVSLLSTQVLDQLRNRILKIADEGGVFKIDLIWENVTGICEKVSS